MKYSIYAKEVTDVTTSWSDILTAALTVINDIRWRKQLATNPAEFYRAKSAYITMALPLLCRPPELLQHLQNGLSEPRYASTGWTVTDGDTSGEVVTIHTGLTGYELMSAVQILPDGMGSTPYPEAKYDAQSGDVTFPPQDKSGTVYSLDFYTDGEFQELTLTQKRLLALAVAVVWDEHFERDWLNKTPKIHDASFETVNEANFIDKSSKSRSDNRAIFEDELRKYEQNCAYAATMPKSRPRVTLI